jgi:hypothetical protein
MDTLTTQIFDLRLLLQTFSNSLTGKRQESLNVGADNLKPLSSRTTQNRDEVSSHRAEFESTSAVRVLRVGVAIHFLTSVSQSGIRGSPGALKLFLGPASKLVDDKDADLILTIKR